MALIYFDNNVFAHVNESGEEAAFDRWLRASQHAALLSFNHLWEALTISDELARKKRVRLLRSVPCRYVTYPPYLEAMELLDEIKRARPSWLRRRPDTSKIDVNLNFHRRLWHIAEHEHETAAEATRVLGEMTKARRRGALEVQKRLRQMKQRGAKGETTLTLGTHQVELGEAASFDEPVAWWRAQSLSNWYYALLEDDYGLTDWADYLGGYLDRRAIEVDDFAAFWLEEAMPQAMPRGFIHFAVVLGQLDHKVGRGNLLDADHASASLDADCFVTEDKALHAVLRAIKQIEGRLPEPCLVVGDRRTTVDAVEASLQAAPLAQSAGSTGHP